MLSPSTTHRDRGDKLRLYAESGIREYWLVDPAQRHADFLVLRDGEFSVAVPLEGHYRSDVLPGVELDLGVLWQDVDARM